MHETERGRSPYLARYAAGVALADPTATRTERSGDSQPARLEQARRLLAEAPAISLHDHPIRFPDPLEPASFDRWRTCSQEELGLDGVALAGVQAMFTGSNSWHRPNELWRWAGRIRSAVLRDPRVDLIESSGDLLAGGDRPGIVLSMETISPLADRPQDLEPLYGIGFRMMGLAYDDGNVLGSGLGCASDDGLTALGRQFVDDAGELGIIVDLSHVGDVTSMDVIRHSRRPVVISHAGSRSLWPTRRMKPDDLLYALADHGGVIGVEAAPNSTRSPQNPRHDVRSVVDHIEHLVALIGVDHVGLGPDTLFGDHGSLSHVRSAHGAPLTPAEQPLLPESLVTHVDGAENPRDAMLAITVELLKRGVSDEDVRQLVGGNALRVWRIVESR